MPLGCLYLILKMLSNVLQPLLLALIVLPAGTSKIIEIHHDDWLVSRICAREYYWIF